MTQASNLSVVLGGASPGHDAFWVEAHRADGSAVSLPVETTPEGRSLYVPPGCQVSVVEKYESIKTDAYTTQSKLQITLAEGAKLGHYKLVHEGLHAIHQSFLEVDVQKSASFHSHVFLFKGAQIRNTIQVRLSGEDADCSLNGLYVGSGQQVIENHTLIEHQKPRGTSRELYKGILDDQSRGLFDGLIVVQKEAQKTDSIQTNKNILLSPDARATSNPEAEDLGQRCEMQARRHDRADQRGFSFFYLRSRGIPAPEARRLLVYAFASEMIQQVEVPGLRDILFPCLSLVTSTKK